MTEQPIRRAESFAVLASCLTLSAIAAIWSWRHGAMLNYGDAVAHLHIARRVFDSRHPGITQLGSVWLPLPHLLLIPFVAVYSWWANGIAGLIPSALAYLAACAGIYRLARNWLHPTAAALALAFFATNTNLLYLQTTAMTEPLFLCEVIWSASGWSSGAELRQERRTAPHACFGCIAAVLVAAVFTRYDGWIMALLAWTGIGIDCFAAAACARAAFWLASAVVVAAPIAWFVYNAVVFGDWLDFARGPYSAKAIETAHRDARLRPATSRLAQSLGLAALLRQDRRDGCFRRSWGNTSACAQPARHGMRLAYRAQARIPLGASPVVAGSLLRLLRRIRIRSHLSAGLVAALLVQHALWNGTAARLCARAWLCRSVRALPPCASSSRVGTVLQRPRSSPSLPSNAGSGARAAADLRRRDQEHRCPPTLRESRFLPFCAHCSPPAPAVRC